MMSNSALSSNVLIAIIGGAAFWYASLTISIVIIFLPAVLLSLMFYYYYFNKSSIEISRFIPLYFLAMSIQLLHFLEEYCTGFAYKVPQLFNQEPYSVDYLIGFNMIAYSVFLLGGIVLYFNRKEYLVIPIFFVLVGVFLNTIGHISISIYVGGYFPGLYTALIYLLVAYLFIQKINKLFQET